MASGLALQRHRIFLILGFFRVLFLPSQKAFNLALQTAPIYTNTRININLNQNSILIQKTGFISVNSQGEVGGCIYAISQDEVSLISISFFNCICEKAICYAGYIKLNMIECCFQNCNTFTFKAECLTTNVSLNVIHNCESTVEKGFIINQANDLELTAMNNTNSKSPDSAISEISPYGNSVIQISFSLFQNASSKSQQILFYPSIFQNTVTTVSNSAFVSCNSILFNLNIQNYFQLNAENTYFINCEQIYDESQKSFFQLNDCFSNYDTGIGIEVDTNLTVPLYEFNSKGFCQYTPSNEFSVENAFHFYMIKFVGIFLVPLFSII